METILGIIVGGIVWLPRFRADAGDEHCGEGWPIGIGRRMELDR